MLIDTLFIYIKYTTLKKSFRKIFLYIIYYNVCYCR